MTRDSAPDPHGADASGETAQDLDRSPLRRWSERKRRAATAVDAPADAGLAVPGSAPGIASGAAVEQDAPLFIDDAVTPIAGETDELPPPLLTDADMPPLDSLDGSSDVSAFLGAGVSAALRRTALRKVFLSPVFNRRDGLNDYDGDYTNFEPLGDTVTSDMKWHRARKEKLAREREEAERLERERLEAEQGAPVDADPDPHAEAEALQDAPPADDTAGAPDVVPGPAPDAEGVAPDPGAEPPADLPEDPPAAPTTAPPPA